MPTKTILVTGATGGQGGGVARHLLATGRYKVRCLTRKPDSERAAALQQAGAEILRGDLEDVEGLKTAMKGCYGVFGVTNYWEHFNRELTHGKNLVDAVAASSIEHFILSTLPNVNRLTGGELDVPHFDIKAQFEEYSRSLSLPATYVHVAFYYDNFLNFLPPRRQEDGSFAVAFPQGDTPLAAVSVEDAGGVIAAIFDRGAKYRCQTVGVVGDDKPVKTYAETMSRLTHQRVIYQHVPREAFAALGFPGADDLANMFDYNRRFIPNRQADLKESRTLYPGLRNFATWLEANIEPFRRALGISTGTSAA